MTVVGTRVLQGVRAIDADQPGPFSTVQYTVLPGPHSVSQIILFSSNLLFINLKFFITIAFFVSGVFCFCKCFRRNFSFKKTVGLWDA